MTPDDLRAETAAHAATVALLTKERDEARAERDALQIDAARYRWLRKRYWWEFGLCVVDAAGSQNAVTAGTTCPSEDRLDAAIDSAARAALSAQQPQGAPEGAGEANHG